MTAQVTLARVLGASLALTTVAYAVATVAGAPFWPLLLIGSFGWFLVIRDRRGLLVSVAAVTLSALWLMLVVLLLTAALRLPLFLTIVVALGAAGVCGAILVLRMNRIERPSGMGVLSSLPALAGALGWLTFAAIHALASGSSQVSWVMLDDSANNVLFARSLTAHAGIVVGASQNPVPLPSAVLALFMAPGRGAVHADDLLLHDLLAFAQLWTVVIALICFLAGLAAASIARAATRHGGVVAVVALSGSVLPLSWVALVYPVQNGFFGSHVAMVILLSAVLVYQGGRQSPRLVLAFQLFACTLLLAVWSPLVSLPLSLALVVAIRHRHLFFQSRGTRLLGLIASVLQFVLYGLVVVTPVLIGQGQFLSAGVATYVFSPALTYGVIAAVLVLAVLARRATGVHALYGAAALACGALVGLEALLINSTRTTGELWTYYPSKFAWTVIVVFLVLILGGLPAALAGLFRLRWLRVLTGAVVVAMALGVGLVAPSVADARLAIPAAGVFASPQRDTVETVLRSANLRSPILHWSSNAADEQFVNFWTIEMASRSASNDKLRTYAYNYRPSSVTDLCAIVRLIGSAVTIETTDGTLASRLSARCPDAQATVDLNK